MSESLLDAMGGAGEGGGYGDRIFGAMPAKVTNTQDPEKLGQVIWYHDTATGKNMDRPGWQKLQAAIDAGQVKQIVVWRLDRLGRTASGLCKLFEDLQAKKVA